jgi:hypothetical protein
MYYVLCIFITNVAGFDLDFLHRSENDDAAAAAAAFDVL